MSERTIDAVTVATVANALITIAIYGHPDPANPTAGDSAIGFASMREVLEGFLAARRQLLAISSSTHSVKMINSLGKVTIDFVARRTYREATAVRDAVDTLVAHPDDLVALSGEVIARVRWPQGAGKSPELGRLSNRAYLAAGIQGNFSRVGYLRGQLDTAALTPTERQLAHTLVLGWEGTLSELVETAQTLDRAETQRSVRCR
jgi:hypothetical protein